MIPKDLLISGVCSQVNLGQCSLEFGYRNEICNIGGRLFHTVATRSLKFFFSMNANVIHFDFKVVISNGNVVRFLRRK